MLLFVRLIDLYSNRLPNRVKSTARRPEEGLSVTRGPVRHQ